MVREREREVEKVGGSDGGERGRVGRERRMEGEKTMKGTTERKSERKGGTKRIESNEIMRSYKRVGSCKSLFPQIQEQ